MTTLTNADLAAIRERYKQCVHESDYADVAEHIPALLDTIAEMREMIAAIVHDTAGWDIHGGEDYYVSADLVDRARALLEKIEGAP